ncbi:MAG: sulfotransferase [Candidatus Aminicenantes bacterium]|nr:sulfotransferase [Candidatus Aminicenantes bacterium]
MVFNFRLFFNLTFRAFFKTKNTHGRLTFKRIKVLVLWYLLFPFHNLVTWICFFLDNIFYPSNKTLEIKEPIFIVGNFRSGSTLLHRVLTKDKKSFTSMKTWEIYLAPSIIQRKFWRKLGIIDRRILGGLLMRLLCLFDENQFGEMPLHKFGIFEAEEDEGLLLHIWSSSLLMFVFPFLEALPPYLFFDSFLPVEERHKVMAFYKRCVQRHLYSNPGKQYIVKNPTFTAKIETLKEFFPDAKFIYLVRNPVDMIASMTNYFSYVFHYFGSPKEKYPYKDEILQFTKHWYTYPLELFKQYQAEEYLIINYDDLVGKLDDSVKGIYRQFNMQMSDEFAKILDLASDSAANYVSKPKYFLAQMGYTPEQVYNNYKNVFEQFKFKLETKTMMVEAREHEAVMD